MAEETPVPVATPAWLDKSLWLVVLGGLFLILNKVFGTSLDAAEVTGLVLPLVVYIVTSKWKQASVLKTAIATRADALRVLKDK